MSVSEVEKKLAKYRADRQREAQVNKYKAMRKGFFSFFEGKKEEPQPKRIQKATEEELIEPLIKPKENLFFKTEFDMMSNADSDEEVEDDNNFSLTLYDYVYYILCFTLWATVYAIFVKLQFGTIYFIVSLLIGIYLNTRTVSNQKTVDKLLQTDELTGMQDKMETSTEDENQVSKTKDLEQTEKHSFEHPDKKDTDDIELLDMVIKETQLLSKKIKNLKIIKTSQYCLLEETLNNLEVAESNLTQLRQMLENNLNNEELKIKVQLENFTKNAKQTQKLEVENFTENSITDDDQTQESEIENFAENSVIDDDKMFLTNFKEKEEKRSLAKAESVFKFFHPTQTETILSNVFTYLTKPELLKAAQVSQFWKEKAQAKTLWKNVTFDNCQLNFEDMGLFLSEKETKRLTLVRCNFISMEYWEMAREYFLFPLLYEKLEELTIVDVKFDDSLFDNLDTLENVNIKLLTLVLITQEAGPVKGDNSAPKESFKAPQKVQENETFVIGTLQNFKNLPGEVVECFKTRQEYRKSMGDALHRLHLEPMMKLIKDKIIKLKRLKRFVLGVTKEYFEDFIQSKYNTGDFDAFLKNLQNILNKVTSNHGLSHLNASVVECK